MESLRLENTEIEKPLDNKEVIKIGMDYKLHVIHTLGHYKTYSKTTAELLFPYNHRHLSPVRVRYDILKNVREVRIIPKEGYYDIEIRYNKKVEDYGLCRDNAIAIDLGMRYPLAIVNNVGLQPILMQGKELKQANYTINTKSPYYRSVQGVYNDILKKTVKNILPIIHEKVQNILKISNGKKM